MIAEDTLKGLINRKTKPREQSFWNKEQVEKILEPTTEPFRSAFHVMSETGLRVGELIHRTWENVDFNLTCAFAKPGIGHRKLATRAMCP